MSICGDNNKVIYKIELINGKYWLRFNKQRMTNHDGIKFHLTDNWSKEMCSGWKEDIELILETRFFGNGKLTGTVYEEYKG